MQCDRCGGEVFVRAGRDRSGRQLQRCRGCGRRLTARSLTAFRDRHFPDEVILLAVRWYLGYRLTYAEVAELLAERGVSVDPSTIWDGSVASEWAGGCHGNLSRLWFPSAVRPRSDRVCECRPSCCEPEGARNLGGQRRERATEVLHHRMPAREHVGGNQVLEPAHRPQALLEVAVITLQAVVEVMRRAVLYRRQDGPECRWVAAGFVSRDPLGGDASLVHGVLEEGPRGRGVPPFTDEHIHDLAVLVDGAVAVGPPPA
jgi:hypothetical protein